MKQNIKWFTFSLVLLWSSVDVSQGRDHLKNKDQTDDFITHESEIGPYRHKLQNKYSSVTQSLNLDSADFPPLGTPNSNTQLSGKRDYVNPSWPHSNIKTSTSASLVTKTTEKNNHQSGNWNSNQQNTNGMNSNNVISGKRDYVNPSWPHSNSNIKTSTSASLVTKPTENNQPGNFNSNQQNINGMNGNNNISGKRDYVNPSWPNSNTKTSTISSSTTTTEKNKHQLGNINSNQQNKNGMQVSNPKRDFVSPNWPALPPSRSSTPSPGNPLPTLPQKNGVGGSTNHHTHFPNTTPRAKEDNPKRDYVVPKRPTPSTPNAQLSTTSTKHSTSTTNKPLDYSAVVSNKNKNDKTYPSSSQRPILPSSILGSISTQKNQPGSSDDELQVLSEELLRKDSNNAAKYITVNIQDKTTSYSPEDKAPLPLLNVPTSVWNMPTIQKMVSLFDNYEWDTLVNEHVSAQERTEENEFMDAVMATPLMRHLMNYLKNKGHVSPDPRQQRDFVKTLWFTLYSRGKGKIGSSGFEHVFVSELKNGQVSGMHNWIYFAREERSNRVNYLGHMKYSEFPDKGAVMKFHFTQQNIDKPVDSMFIGLSPEMQMSLYTLCFVTRADRDCKLKLGGKDVNIVTHSFRYRGKNLIGSAYPEI